MTTEAVKQPELVEITNKLYCLLKEQEKMLEQLHKKLSSIYEHPELIELKTPPIHRDESESVVGAINKSLDLLKSNNEQLEVNILHLSAIV